MDRYEYMFIPYADIPQDIRAQYNLSDFVNNGRIYVELHKSIYGLPQAGKLADNRLVPILGDAGYHPAEHTAGRALIIVQETP